MQLTAVNRGSVNCGTDALLRSVQPFLEKKCNAWPTLAFEYANRTVLITVPNLQDLVLLNTGHWYKKYVTVRTAIFDKKVITPVLSYN